MSKHQMPFELVFKRGGESPAEIKSWHLTVDSAEAEARKELARQQGAGHTAVWLAYDLWDHSGGRRPKRLQKNTVMQHPQG